MSESEAREILKQAENLAAYKGWFGANKLDEAADLYANAGNSFKLSKNWKESGDAFIAQANILLKMGEDGEASSAFMNAAKSFRKSNPVDAVSALTQAVAILIKKGRFSTAATNQKLIAEIYETELLDPVKASEAYEKAADWFMAEESKASADQCILKSASFAAEAGNFESALSKFEDVAGRCVDNKLTKWSMKEYFLKAGICLLNIGDSVLTKKSLEKYSQMDVTFAETREYKLIVALNDAVEAGDVESYTNAVVEFDNLSKLDSWKTSLLLRVKKSIGEEDLT